MSVSMRTAPETRLRAREGMSMLARGEPMLFLTGGALLLSLGMIAGLLGWVFARGSATFWPAPIVEIRARDGTVLLGEPTRRESARTPEGERGRILLRTENFELTGEHFRYVDEADIAAETRPAWATLVERLAGGPFYGFPVAFLEDGRPVAEEPGAIHSLFAERHAAVRARRAEIRRLESRGIGTVSARLESARLAIREAQIAGGVGSAAEEAARRRYPEVEAQAHLDLDRLGSRIEALRAENARFSLLLSTAGGEQKAIPLGDIVRILAPNRMGPSAKLRVYLSRWWEFLSDLPREANSEGGVFPAIFGTVTMTLIMSIVVVPFGVLAALYLREYAKPGLVTSAVRIAINNLAGVPSIVFGVFGLGFFCYIVGASIDEILFRASLPNPTYGKGGILWASLTLALLTLPVVIVATEEALSAVPSSMREGSYACGASKWQTIRRIVMPRAMPGIMTGAILAVARGAGEVAPLMLVGAVKLAPELPIDGIFPYIHPERSFMHLGFHIYDLGFQSQNSEAAKPMVYTTTALLIAIVAILNIAAIALRTRLRRKFAIGQS